MNWLAIIIPPLLMVIGGILTWLIKSRTDELRATEAQLRDERQKIYSDILDPIIRLFSNIGEKGEAQATKQILSYDYRKTGFDLILLGSDEVVKSYNALMQYLYKTSAEGQSPDSLETLNLWGCVLLEIRKSLGNKKTKLNQVDMLSFMIKDISKLQAKLKEQSA